MLASFRYRSQSANESLVGTHNLVPSTIYNHNNLTAVEYITFTPTASIEFTSRNRRCDRSGGRALCAAEHPCDKVMSISTFSHEDNTLLDGLANLHRAVGNDAIRQACEQFRERLLAQRDRLVIGAEALKLFLQIRSNRTGVDTEAPEWMDFFSSAESIDCGQRHAHIKPAKATELRRLRATARLTALWGAEVLMHYGFTRWNPKKLEHLATCAEAVSDFEDFVRIASCVLLQRHETSLTSNRIDRIGQHTLTNQHVSADRAPLSEQPLQNKDVNHILDFLQGKEVIIIGGIRCESREQLYDHRDRLDEWVQDEIGELSVAGKAVRHFSRYQRANYRLRYDVYGLLIPREKDHSVQPRESQQRKRKRHDDEIKTSAGKGPLRVNPMEQLRMCPAYTSVTLSTSTQNANDLPSRLIPESPRSYSFDNSHGSDAAPRDTIRHTTCVPDLDSRDSAVTSAVATLNVGAEQPGVLITTDSDVAASIPSSARVRCKARVPHAASCNPGMDSTSLSQMGTVAALMPELGLIQSSGCNLAVDGAERDTRVSSLAFGLPIGQSCSLGESSMSSKVLHSPLRTTMEGHVGRRDRTDQLVGLDLDPPMTSHFDEQLPYQHHSMTPTLDANEVCLPSHDSTLIDVCNFASSDLGTARHDVSETPCSFTSWLNILPTPSPSAIPPGSQSSVIKDPTNYSSGNYSATASSADLSDMWLKLPELQRQPRLSPFADEHKADKFYVATPDQIEDAISSGFQFKKPIVTKYSFLDSHIHTPEKFATDLRRFYPRDEFRLEFNDGQLCSVGADQLATLIRDQSSKPNSALEFNALSCCNVAPFLLNTRFCLLDALAERTNEDVDLLPFSTLSFPDTFLGPYLHSISGSHLRPLFGKQRLMVVLLEELSNEQRIEFKSLGGAWQPPIDSGQAVRLEVDDVVLMPPGVKIIHCIYIDELSLTHSVPLWDFLAVKDILSGLAHVLDYPLSRPDFNLNTFTRFLKELESWIYDEPELFTNANTKAFQQDVQLILERLRAN